MAYHLTREALRLDLMAAHQCAKRHKASRPYVLHFERRLEDEIDSLCDDLWQHCYQPEPSTCFIVEHPKKREVFAAQYRDRIVHHLYFNYCHCLFERTFISDCYACIEQRGTHYGQHRLQRHIRQESQGYQRPCYVMKLDLRGYVKARTVYISTASLRRMERKVRETCAAISTAVRRRGMVSPEHAEAVSRSLNSFLGVLCHYDSFHVRSRLLLVPSLLAIGRFNAGITRFVIHSPVCYCTTAASR